MFVNTTLSVLSGYTATLGISPLFQEKRSMPTLMFRLLFVEEIELFCEAAPNQVCWT
jgi:hypothetical protein